MSNEINQEMLAALKDAREALGGLASLDLRDSVWRRIGTIVAKAEPPKPFDLNTQEGCNKLHDATYWKTLYEKEVAKGKPLNLRRWLVESPDDPRIGLGRATDIREVKPITRQQIEEATSQSDFYPAPINTRGMQKAELFLQALGIEVED